MKRAEGRSARTGPVAASDIVAAVGFVAVCGGLAMVSVALALVVGGSILLAVSIAGHLRGRKP